MRRKSRRGIKLSYPKHRKSPIKHSVKSHVREGGRVRAFQRGKGVKPAVRSFATKRLIQKVPKAKAYICNLTYSNRPGDGETLTIFGPGGMAGYKKVLDECWEEKHDLRDPIEIHVIDPSLGDVLKYVGTGAKKVAHLGGKFAVKGGHIAYRAGVITGKGLKVAGRIGAKEAVKTFRSAAERGRVMIILNQCYSKNKYIRITARQKLLKKYPSVYDIAEFSQDLPLTKTRLREEARAKREEIRVKEREVETEKMRAETKKLKAETTRVRAESRLIKAEIAKIGAGLLRQAKIAKAKGEPITKRQKKLYIKEAIKRSKMTPEQRKILEEKAATRTKETDRW